MDVCQTCQYLDECKNINIPTEVIAFIIDLMEAKNDDREIEQKVLDTFNRTVDSYGSSMKMLRKYLLAFQDTCINQRKDSNDGT